MNVVSRRIASFAVTVFLAGTVTYVLPKLPSIWSGDGQLPGPSAFIDWWAWVLQGGFIDPAVTQAIPWTLSLMGLATVVSFVVGSIAGALLASPFGKIGTLAQWSTPAALTLYATPYFILGMVLIWLFVWLVDLFPPGGGYSLGESPELSWHGIQTILWHGTLPISSIVLAGIAHWLVLMRAMMVTVEGEDYVTLSRAMGLNETRIFTWYRMRNCALPQVTQLFLSLGIIFTGAVMVEIVFAYPGIGYLLQQAILSNNASQLQSIVITTALMFALLLAVMESLYPVIDRRIGKA